MNIRTHPYIRVHHIRVRIRTLYGPDAGNACHGACACMVSMYVCMCACVCVCSMHVIYVCVCGCVKLQILRPRVLCSRSEITRCFVSSRADIDPDVCTTPDSRPESRADYR
jgi:hypothetical protein